jgi:hypothetical protein
MKTHLTNKTKRAILAIAVAIVFSLSALADTPDCAHSNGVDFRLFTDNSVYSPGSLMHVWFIVGNNGQTPIYILRSISECTDLEGSFAFRIFDKTNRDVTDNGCSSDVGPSWETHVMDQMTDAKLWIALQPGEIFGRESTFEAPKAKGTYRLRASVVPPGFTEKLRQILSENRIRVLTCSCSAPEVKIAVK